MNKEELKWDVSDIDPTIMFPKDCRYYNGGLVAPEEIKQFWENSSEGNKKSNLAQINSKCYSIKERKDD